MKQLKSYFYYRSSFHIMHKKCKPIEAIRLSDFNYKRTKYEKGTNATKKILAEWIKSRSYGKLKSGN